MKLAQIITIFLAVFTLSGCFMVDLNGRAGGGPPPWAPAHGYRNKQATTIVFDSTQIVVIQKKGNSGWHKGHSHGKHK